MPNVGAGMPLIARLTLSLLSNRCKAESGSGVGIIPYAAQAFLISSSADVLPRPTIVKIVVSLYPPLSQFKLNTILLSGITGLAEKYLLPSIPISSAVKAMNITLLLGGC